MLWRTRPLPLITLLRLCLALRIDDFDHTVEYHGAWTDGKSIPDDVSQNWDSTLHYSNFSGSTATLKFTGTSIAVFGSVHPPGRYNMQSLYSVDGQPPFTFIPNPDVPTAIHQSLFYSSPSFPYGEHTLVVTNLGEQLFLDFFDVQDETQLMSSSTTPAVSATVALTPTSTPPFGDGQTATASTHPTTTNALPTSETQETGVYPQNPSTTKVSDSSHITTPTALRSGSPTTSSAEIPVTSNIANGTTSTLTPITPPRNTTLSTRAIAGVVVSGALVAMFSGLGVWFCRRRRMNGSDSESNDLYASSPKDVAVVDSCVPDRVEAETSARDYVMVINTSSSSNTTTLDRPQTPLRNCSGHSPSPIQKEDDVPQGVTTDLLSPAIPSAEHSNVLSCILPRPNDVYASLSNYGIPTTKSETPLEPLQLPPVRANNEGIPSISAYTPGVGRASVGARIRRLRIQEDGGIRLDGGPPGEAQVEEEDSDVFEDLPPPYQQF